MSSKKAIVPLENKITLGGKSISEIEIRQPAGGELRGMSLVSIVQMEMNSLEQIIPRISSPKITKGDMQQLTFTDLVNIGMEIVGFLNLAGDFKGQE